MHFIKKIRFPKAFTLIETIAAVSILGILGVQSTVTFGSQSTKANDTSRISDIKMLQSGVEQFYQEMAQYPNNAKGKNTTYNFTGKDGKSGILIYVPSLPKDPTHGQICHNGGKTGNETVCTYLYNSQRDVYGIEGGEYKLSTGFENAGNVREKAAKDGGAANEGSRLEIGLNLSNGKSTQCKPKKNNNSSSGVGRGSALCKGGAATDSALFIAGNPK